jgi:hypothetical protein
VTVSFLIATTGSSLGQEGPPYQYQDGFTGAAGYMPHFHPRGLSPDEIRQARTGVYQKTPDPSNVSLESSLYTAEIACYGRGFDPRGPFADPPQAPFLLPGNISAVTFGDSMIPGGGMYVAVAGIGFNNVVSGTPNNDPSTGPIVNPANAPGIYEVGLGSDGKCNQLRAVSGGPTNAGSNAGPQPEFGDFGTSIDGLAWHNGKLYVNDFSGGAQGARSGPRFSGGRLHEVDPASGARVALIANLPSEGDHQNDAEVFFTEGGAEWLEFEQGTTTNAGTVDGEDLGDIPCYDVRLTDAGKRFYPFVTGYKRTEKNLPDGKSLVEPQANGDIIVRGTLPCSGSTMAVRLDQPIEADGTNASLRLTGFGFRNPYSMMIAPDSVPGIGGELLVSNNDVDVRGQRPLANGGDDWWPFEVNGRPVRNWGWPNQVNFFSTADPQFGLANNQLAGDGGVYTGNQSRRDDAQPGQAIVGQAPIFAYIGEENGVLQRGGQPLSPDEQPDPAFVPGIALATVDISADGFDFSRNNAFGFVNDFFAAGFGNLEFPLGSAPTGVIGKDVRHYRVATTNNGKYVGTIQTVFAKNKNQPGGWPNLNTGGFLGPLDLKFNPAGDTMYLVDFGSFFTIDSGAVGGFRCDDPNGSACSNGAKQMPNAALTQKDYGITIEQLPGTSALWRFRRTGGSGGGSAPGGTTASPAAGSPGLGAGPGAPAPAAAAPAVGNPASSPAARGGTAPAPAAVVPSPAQIPAASEQTGASTDETSEDAGD